MYGRAIITFDQTSKGLTNIVENKEYKVRFYQKKREANCNIPNYFSCCYFLAVFHFFSFFGLQRLRAADSLPGT